jgi:hypothetical protein
MTEDMTMQVRSIRIPNNVWHALKAAAAANGTSASAVLADAAARYVRRNRKP